MAEGSGVSFVGLPALLSKFMRAQVLAATVAQRGIYARALSIFQKSQVLVPVEFGTLRSSGTISQPRQTSGGWEVEIGYGGAASEYAIYVHEITSNYHAPPTQAKFLEQPAMEEAARFAGELAAEFSILFR